MSKHKRKAVSQEHTVENGRPGKRVRTEHSSADATPGDSAAVSQHITDGTTSGDLNQFSRKKKKALERQQRRIELGIPKERWTISEAVGGHLQDLDPIFSIDERYLLLAYESFVGVYHADSTALQIHTLRVSKDKHITGFALGPENTQLYISLISGLIELWDWIRGERLGKWNTNSQVYGLATAQYLKPDSKCDIVYTIDFDGHCRDKCRITAHRLRIGDDNQLQTLYKSQIPITQLKVSDNGRVLVGSAGQRILIGYTNEPDLVNLKEVSYEWREIESSEWITSLDVKVLIDGGFSAKAKKSQLQALPDVNVVVGGLKGALFSYRDVLGNLKRKESRQDSVTPFAQKLHWHRNGVSTVKWSLDGNYIISGGIETVLVLWQLDTGKKQFLPHLSAAIESIVVSPSGMSYVIRLASNSVKILSTTELQPIFSMSGLQISHQRQSAIKPPNVSTVTVSHQGNQTAATRFPATVTSNNQILLAAPAASSPSRIGLPQEMNATFLQTVDTKSGSQISNQALTRTKVTTLNMGPEANLIETPHVTLLQISHDGQWLATVDEWSPPMLDIEPLTIDWQASIEEQKLRTEVYLKFWAWNGNNWELISRIDGPHAAQLCSFRIEGKILDLIADPSSTGFITVGEDWSVKRWKPKRRKRNGVEVLDKNKKPHWNWGCQLSITLPLNVVFQYKQNSAQPNAKLAISEDGSLLIVGHQRSTDPLFHIIDTVNGNIVSTHTDVLFGHLKGLGIIHRYLVLLSGNELVVWDLVDDEMHYSFTLDAHTVESRRERETETTQLAVDQKNQTFAVTIAGRPGSSRSQVTIFEPSSSSYLYTYQLPQDLKVLLPLTQWKGYLAIDSLAEIRVFTPQSQIVNPQREVEQDQPKTTAGLENIFNSLQSKTALSVNAKDELPLDTDDVPVVRQHQLTEIFDRPISELPSMTEMFREVAKLFSKKGKIK